MTIAQRMYLLIFSAFVGLAGLAGLGIFQINRVFTAADFASVNVVPSLIALDQSARAIGRERAETWEYVAVKDPASRSKLAASIVEEQGKAIAPIALYEKEYIADDKDRAMLKEDHESIDAYKALSDKARALADADKADEAHEMLITNQNVSSRINNAFETHNDYNITLAKQGEAEADTILKHANWQAIAIALAIIATVAGMGLMITHRLSKSLAEAVMIAQTVATGDLTGRIEVTSNDEIGKLLQALKDMNDSLVRIVGQVRVSTDTIATASAEIASGNMDLSARTESQASSLEETAASMEELTSTVKQNADNARQANQLAQTASEVAIRGGSVVSEVVDTMGAINDSSKKIVDIISVIDGIAFQTNILALNAAVEAARAGEQGRGFAVVATEVRNLAQRSASAAKEIKSLINTSVEKVDLGSKLVDQAGTTMNEVVDSIRRVTDIMSEITAASQEQSQGIGQVNEAVVTMDNVTQQNAALVEEAAAAAGAMQEQAANLTDVVSVFKLNGAPTHSSKTVAKTAETVRQSVNVASLGGKSNPSRIAMKGSADTPIKHIASGSRQEDDWEQF